MNIMGLPNREFQIAQLLARGQSQCEIAADLGISVNTVRTYIRRAKKRTGSRSTTELAVKCALGSKAAE